MATRRKFKKRRRFGGISLRAKPVYSKYEAAYKFFAVTAVCSLICSAVYALTERAAGGLLSAAIALLFGGGGVWLGYGIAALWGSLTACERVRQEHSYERTESYFSFGTLIPAVITAVFPSIGALLATRELTATVTSSGTVIYDNASATPAVIGGALFACLVLGILLWFIPYNKVISIGNVLPIGVGFIIVAVAGGVFYGASTAFLTVAFVFYLFSAMAVINQGYLIKIINDSGTGTATEQVRRYNLAAVALAFGCIAVAGFFATAVIVGIVVSCRIVLYSVFKKALNGGGSGSGSSIGSTPSFNASEKLFGGITGTDGEGQAAFYYIVFLLMILAFVIALIVHRRRSGKRLPKPSELVSRLFNLILAVIAWFGSFFSTKRHDETDIALDDYTDEELIMDKNAGNSVRSLSGKRGAKRLARMMAECKTEGERLSVCYRASVASYLKKFSILKKGDTPSVMLNKLNGITAEQDRLRFGRLTEAFVMRAYAGIEPTPALSTDITAETERLITELTDHAAQ